MDSRSDMTASHKGEGAAETAPSSRLGRMRLLVALDCLLVEGSVGKAAARLGLSDAAMSRLLSQARALYADQLFIRSGRRLVPTPRAEALRKRLRALAAEADALVEGTETPLAQDHAAAESWRRAPIIDAPPLAMRPAFALDDQPSPEALAQQIARIHEENDPRRRVAKYIATIGRKLGNSRPLTIAEAEDAFAAVLHGGADPAQIGALLRLISYRGETAPEIAGLTLAARGRALTSFGSTARVADLDWPAYLSPRSLRTPWFLQAACLVARAGYRVVLHGSYASGASGKLEYAADALGIPICLSVAEAHVALDRASIAYLPLAAISPQMQGLLSLYPLFESRSPANSAVHLLNPLAARASFLGVTQPAYRELHRDAAALLGWKDLTVIGSSRDVAEWIPYRSISIHRLVGGEARDQRLQALEEPRAEQRIGLTSFEYWHAVWQGTAHDERVMRIVLATAALALMTIERTGEDGFSSTYRKAEMLWNARMK
ncbi:glycosyl transferase family protein [Pseudaminobacter salicylatoxidans]|uniref:glycosyl transferase family protein n=1 Tax=Pseudaminobacter salicylatoxidans TaxID=93369 RepID=UPI000316E3BE|nr:glycosyl transferase family protein [Pseudaminobacter salicylatoxidans]